MDSNAAGTDTGRMPLAETPSPCPPAPVADATGRWPLAALQALPQADFEAVLGPAVEHAPWVARRAWAARPFADTAALVQAMRVVIAEATPQEQVELLRGHPELAGSEARAGRMTAESTSEQARLGLDRLDAATLQQLQALNARYRQRFGWPLLVALRLHADLDSVLQQAQARLLHEPAQERTVALQQVGEVMAGRVQRLLAPELPQRPEPPRPDRPGPAPHPPHHP